MLFIKDTEIICPDCESLMFVFCRDIEDGEPCKRDQVYPDKGQAPFEGGQKIACKNCGWKWLTPMLLKQHQPIIRRPENA